MKKIIAIAAAAALAATLCACGSSSSASSSSSSSSSATSAATSSSSSSQKISDDAWEKMSDSISNIVADEWEGYSNYTIDLSEKDAYARIYISTQSGMKETLANASDTAKQAWEDLKAGTIEQNENIKQAAASTMPNIQVETYLIEDLDVDAVNQAIEANGSYTPTSYVLYVKDSTVVYDVAAE